MTSPSLYRVTELVPGISTRDDAIAKLGPPISTSNIGTSAIQEGPSRFAIFDTFDDDAGRNAHLNGKVAAALMEKVKTGNLFAKAPEIHRIDVLADKLPH